MLVYNSHIEPVIFARLFHNIYLRIKVQCSPMLIGPSDIDDNFRLGPTNRSPTADRVPSVIFGPKGPCVKQCCSMTCPFTYCSMLFTYRNCSARTNYLPLKSSKQYVPETQLQYHYRKNYLCVVESKSR